MSTATPGFIGPYRLLNVVHTGHASQIWQAYHDGKKQIFGIKTLLEKSRRDREEVGYLRWEYAVARTLDHERIVKIYEYETDRGIPYLAMEWFAFPNMKRRIQAGSDKIAHLLSKIIEQSAEALAHSNRIGWVHRDVKPDNFLVSDEGDVKLIDFALAQRIKRGLGKLLATKTKIQGTRSYMAPEQIRGRALDARADVYSFGCTVHELLSGRPPYTGASADELLTKHLKSTPPSLEGPSLEGSSGHVATQIPKFAAFPMKQAPSPAAHPAMQAVLPPHVVRQATLNGASSAQIVSNLA